MSINKFIQPLFDFPTSSIINEIENKSYSYQEFYTEILRIEYEFENLRIEKNSIVVIYGYRSSFKTLMLFFFCIKNDLIPFIVEQGNLSYIDDLNFNILITTESLIFKKERGMALWEVSELGKKPSAQHLCKEDSSFNSIVCKGELESYGEYEFNKHWLRYKYINPSFWFDLEHSAATPNIEIGKCSAI